MKTIPLIALRFQGRALYLLGLLEHEVNLYSLNEPQNVLWLIHQEIQILKFWLT